jgi:transitional endoplasmic reticulum ATPase
MPNEPATPRQPPSPEQLESIWNRIVLDADAKARLLDCIRRFNDRAAAPPRGLLIYGPPGTGKTQIIRLIAQSVSSTFMPLTVKDLRAGYIGQTSALVRELWRKARGHGRCVVTLDWCEGIFARPGSPHGDVMAEELLIEFRSQWEESAEQGGGVWFVGETYRPEPMHPAILSLFDTIVETRLPATWAERAAIMTLWLQDQGLTPEIPTFVDAATAGMSGRDLSSWARKVYLQAASQGEAAPSAPTWRNVLEKLRRSA